MRMTLQGHPLEGLGRQDWSPSWQSDLVSAIDTFQAACATFEQRALAFCNLIALGKPQASYTAMMALTALGSNLCDPHAAVGRLFLTPEAGRLRAAIVRLRPIVEKAATLRTQLSTPYRDGVFALDVPGVLAEWHEAVASNMFVRSGKKKRVRAKLAAFCDGQVPEDCGRDLALLIDLVALAAEAKTMASDLMLLGSAYDGLSTDLATIEAGVQWSQKVEQICKVLSRQKETDSLIDFVATLVRDRAHLFVQGADGHVLAKGLHEAWSTLRAAVKSLGDLAETDASLGLNIRQDWFAHATARTQSWKSARQRIPMWCAWRKVAEEAKTWGLGPLLEAVQSGIVDRQRIPMVFEAAYAAWWIERVVDVDPVLRRFVAQRQESAIARFREADERVAELATRIVRARLAGNVPAPTAFGQDIEWGTLSRELEKKARHMPLRQLFAKLPTVLPKLAPCVMMSPLSIAQYLPADAQPFDVIVFDEASQIPVWDAIGALTRGNQVIIVGDPKQLPPTTFFDRTDDLEQDAYDTEDLESILDECLASNVPHRRLTWHYRSRHESLIAFSNARYYEGALITFPSPVTTDHAVRFVHVPGGVYERGTGHVNRLEAQQLVEDLVRRLKDPSFALERLSIGIVSFNAAQQTLIENLLDQECRQDPAIEQFFPGREWHEPVFVKNLENVQGDERDIILFSVGYGPDAAGRVSHNFGPLNKIGGERRLNVAITRARRELVVFSTLRPEDINVARAPGRGVRDFKHFLEYAERGARAIAEAFAPTGHETDSPFEDAVKARLEGKGWEVHPQVGVSGFRIDLGVVHPDMPGRYLAGVECDGATYHRAATARDRDRLREMVLRDLGWRIRRVWSTEWWMDADTACERLHAQLTQDLEEQRQSTVEKATAAAAQAEDHEEVTTNAVTLDDEVSTAPDTDAKDASAQEPSRDMERPQLVARGYTLEPVAPLTPRMLAPYSPIDLLATFTPEPLKFYDTAYRPVLQRMAADVISREGPIMESVLVHRIARAHGFQRSGPRIQEIIQGVVEQKFRLSREGDRTIYWPEGANNTGFWPLRGPGEEPRSVADIPLVELASRASELLRETEEVDEVVARMVQDLGLGRLRQPTRARLMDAIRLTESFPPASR